MKNRIFHFFTQKVFTWPFFFAAILIIIFFWPITQGAIPLPMDALVGAYFPWLDYKYGYPVGVPVQNSSLSDVFAQEYPWKLLVMQAWRMGQVPLWNPYSFSGTPLLANWQSAPMYPLTQLMTIFGSVWGWTMMIVAQISLSLWFMYLFLKQLHGQKIAALIGAIIFAFSGFMMTFLQYTTTGQVFMWLPLCLYFLEKYFQTQQRQFIIFTALFLYCLLTAGFFQPALYGLLIIATYLIFRSPSQTNPVKNFITNSLILLIGIATAAVQLLPTFEFVTLSIRNFDHNIAQYDFGLLPFQHLATLFAPDFLGNPATRNFWGVLGYQESSGYFSILVWPLLFLLVKKQYRTPHTYFFLAWFILSLLLVFDNPFSRLIYDNQIPGISTGYAARWFLITGFAAATLASLILSQLKNPKQLRISIPIATITFTLIAAFVVYQQQGVSDWLTRGIRPAPEIIQHLTIAARNSVIPLALLFIWWLASLFVKNRTFFLIITLFLISFDMFRYAHKFTPFSPQKLLNVDTPITEFLQENSNYYRIEREAGAIYPSNAWIYNQLYSPSGYDPLIYKPYAVWHRLYNHGVAPPSEFHHNIDQGSFTRYLEMGNFKSPILDLAGVKYMMGIKYDSEGRPDPSGEDINYQYKESFYPIAFEDQSTTIVENPDVMPRLIFYDSFDVESDDIHAIQRLRNGYNYRQHVILNQLPTDEKLNTTSTDAATFTDYSFNHVTIDTHTENPTILVLTDTNYPGWTAEINGQPTPVYTAHGIYRAVLVPSGDNTITFTFKPRSFTYGLTITIISLTALITLLALPSLLRRGWGWSKTETIPKHEKPTKRPKRKTLSKH